MLLILVLIGSAVVWHLTRDVGQFPKLKSKVPTFDPDAGVHWTPWTRGYLDGALMINQSEARLKALEQPSLSQTMRPMYRLPVPVEAEVLPEVAPVPAREPSVVPVFFKDGEPTRLTEFGAQPHIVDLLTKSIAALDPTEARMDPQLFMGTAGSGKTLLAKIVAHELQLRAERLGLPRPVFVEVFPADLDSVEALDKLLERVADEPAAVVFIDEVHGLDGTHSHKLYELLANQRYMFRNRLTPVELPNVTLLAATTDYGALHPALQRRWIRHYFEAASPVELLAFIERRPYPIERTASSLIVERTKHSGQPWEAIELYRLAVVSAKARNAPLIERQDVEWVIDHQGIDALGLRRMDRQVLAALLASPRTLRSGEVVYGASENDTVAMARVDKQEYRETIRPRLMTRGLLAMRPGVGQVLTQLAVDMYGKAD